MSSKTVWTKMYTFKYAISMKFSACLGIPPFHDASARHKARNMSCLAPLDPMVLLLGMPINPTNAIRSISCVSHRS